MTLSGVTTAKSAFFSDSFMMRAQGADAVYWNPALLNPAYNDVQVPEINQTFYLTNNAFDLDTYNFISGRKLTERDKDKILGKIHNNIMLKGEFNSTLFGISFQNMAFSSATHTLFSAKISKNYLKLLLHGNEDENYVFDNTDNHVGGLAYQDFTLGAGNFNLTGLLGSDKIPAVNFGASGSLLAGIGIADSKGYRGYLHDGISDVSGLSFRQDVKLDTGILGGGGKVMLGLASEPIPHLATGVTLDNLFGTIHWFGKTEEKSYSVHADSIYVNELSDSLYTQTDSTTSISKFTTKIPVEFRWGVMYSLPKASFSLDWVQGFQNSLLTSCIGKLSLGAQYSPVPFLPLSMGVTFGNSGYPWRISYGVGVCAKHCNLGISLQSIQSLLPGYQSKGIALSSYLTFSY